MFGVSVATRAHGRAHAVRMAHVRSLSSSGPHVPRYEHTSQHYYREKADPAYIRALTESVRDVTPCHVGPPRVLLTPCM